MVAPSDHGGLPKISVVTPSYNQAAFLERTIQSIVNQGYPNLEYVIIDGGSQDGSVDIIKNYAKHLHYWVSEPDRGQYDAINRGFARTTGEIMAWLNSDDCYVPWAFQVVGSIFATLPEVEWLTTLRLMTSDENDMAMTCYARAPFSRQGFFRGENLPRKSAYSTGCIQQESTFWRRPLWQRAGGRVDDGLRLAGDFELWARFFQYADLYGVAIPLGNFRMHRHQKTARLLDEYLHEAKAVLKRHGGRPYGRLEFFVRSRILPRIPHRLRGYGVARHYVRKLAVERHPELGWTVEPHWHGW